MLKVNEIFISIDGEVNLWGQGIPTVFIRLNGCNLQCDYCDTQNKKQIHIMLIEDILKIIPHGIKITITGGEPLLQPDCIKLIDILLKNNFKISVETNGSMPIPKIINNNISWIIDYKLKYCMKMYMDNFYDAGERDWIKFVIEDEQDLEKAIEVYILLKKMNCKARIAFSPVFKSSFHQTWLVNEIIKRQLWDITFNLQIHKYIWLDKEGESLI